MNKKRGFVKMGTDNLDDLKKSKKYDCEAFEKNLDEAREEIKSGKCETLTIKELKERLGIF